jgi:hypothetical protein
MQRRDGTSEGVGPFPRTALGRRFVRMQVRLRRRRLDAALAAGCNPWGSPELTLRAAALAAPQERRKVAVALATVVECAERGRSVCRYLKLRERAVLLERDALVELAVRLSGSEPVPPAVIAQLEWLLWDECSPLYAGGESPDVIPDITERCLLATG